MMVISSTVLDKVNAIRQRADFEALTELQLRELLDWTAEPRQPSVTKVGLLRFSAVLGFKITNDQEGTQVYLCATSEEQAREIAIQIHGTMRLWLEANPMGPRDFLGWAVLLPRDVVSLATEASLAMREAWYSG